MAQLAALHAPPLAISGAQLFMPPAPALHQYFVDEPVSQSASLAQFVLQVLPVAHAKLPGQSSFVPVHVAPPLQPPESTPALHVSAHVVHVGPQNASVVHALQLVEPFDGQ